MPTHPDRETLKRFICGELPSEEARRADQHLSVCAECRNRLEVISKQLVPRLLESWLLPGYDEAFVRAADRAGDRLADLVEESHRTDDLLAELLREAVPARRRRIANDERFHSLKLCQVLRSRSRGAWFSDPTLSLEMADLAVEVGQHLESGRYGSNLVEDSRALAWAYLGNAFRIKSDLWRAEKAMHEAWTHHFKAGADPCSEWELLSIMSSLRDNQGLYREALDVSDRAIAICREAEDRHSEGIALMRKACVLGSVGQHREMRSVIGASLERIDPAENFRLLAQGKHNLSLSYFLGGEPVKAAELLKETRFLYREMGDLVSLARLRWHEGRILARFGPPAAAEHAFLDTFEFFLNRQSGIEVFLVSLDLASIYASIGRRAQTRELLNETIPLGEALGLRKEVLMARLLYQQMGWS